MKLIYLKLSVLLLISVIPVVLFNYLIDPYGIFNDSGPDLWFEPGYEPNQHYAKIRHLINDNHSYDSYIFGSSRAGKINPDLIPEGNYYNLNYSEGIPGEHLEDIRVLLEKRIPVRNVLIGLDNFSYMVRPEDHKGQIMRYPYDRSPFRRKLFQIKYLISAPQISMIGNIKSIKNDSSINFNILGNGMQNLEQIDARIESNLGNHLKSERFLEVNNISFERTSEKKYMDYMDDTIQDIAEIIKLSKKNNFNLFFFINPTHHFFYSKNNPYFFLLFKKKLSALTNFWDFSGFNTITTSNYFYYETSHYRTKVGDLIICRMFDCADISVPEDFGVFVTKENIDAHIKKQKDELTFRSIL